MTKVADILARYTSESQMNTYAENNGFSAHLAANSSQEANNPHGLYDEFISRGISVLWFGAAKDGVTDDLQAFNDAASIAETESCNVWVPPGTYYLSAYPTIAEGVSFLGYNVTILGATSFVMDNIENNDNYDFKYYNSAGVWFNGVRADYPYVTGLNGMYCRGKYLKNQNIRKVKFESQLYAEFPSALDDGTEQASTWYAVYLVLDNGTVKMKYVPFIRVLSDTSNVVTFATHLDKTIAQNFGFTTNSKVGKKFVVQTTGTTNNDQVGEVREITINTDTTIAYSGDSLGLTQGAFIMIEPVGYNHYKYIGCFYNDASSNVLNFTKKGGRYESQALTPFTGLTNTSAEYKDFGGYIPPTAVTAIILGKVTSGATPTGGKVLGYALGPDTAHYTKRPIWISVNVAAVQIAQDEKSVDMNYPPFISANGITSTDFASYTLQVFGWEE